MTGKPIDEVVRLLNEAGYHDAADALTAAQQQAAADATQKQEQPVTYPQLLPLPEWQGDFMTESEFCEQAQDYALACIAYATDAKDAVIVDLQSTIEALQAEVGRMKDMAMMQAARAAAAEREVSHRKVRAERLAEALRDARRALAFAAQHLPECNEPYERANLALTQEDRNG